MKNSKGLVIAVIAGFLGLTFTGYQSSWAKSQQPAAPVKVAVVSISRVFDNSKKHKQWQEMMNSEQDKINAELDKMKKELDAVQADIKTRQPGSADYFKLMQEYAERDAALKAKNKMFEQQMVMKMQFWTETLYQKVADAAGEVAKEKGFDMVLVKEAVNLPSGSMSELMTIIRTNTVIYYDEKLDITDDVTAIVDGDREKPAPAVQPAVAPAGPTVPAQKPQNPQEIKQSKPPTEVE